MKRCRTNLSRAIEFDPREWLERMERASSYIAAQFRINMPRNEAIVNFETRRILLRLRFQMIDEYEAASRSGAGEPSCER